MKEIRRRDRERERERTAGLELLEVEREYKTTQGRKINEGGMKLREGRAVMSRGWRGKQVRKYSRENKV